MLILGSLDDFHPDAECFSAYLEIAKIFFTANDIAEDKQVPVFFNAIVTTTYGFIRNLLAPADPMSKTLKVITDTLSAHFEPKPLVVVERYHFHKRDQAPGESVVDFMAELRQLVAKCNFANFLDNALHDRFMVGLRNKSIQKRLLAEPDLTITDSVTLPQNMEAAHTKSQAMKTASAALTVGKMEQQPAATSSTTRGDLFLLWKFRT